MMPASTNPFDTAPSDFNFPPMSQIFLASPSIDTIARTKPVDFSAERSFGSRSCMASQQQSPLVGSSGCNVEHAHAQSPRQRPRVVKQLFSRESAQRSKGVSRALATAAGWPTPGRPCQSAPGATRSVPAPSAVPAAADSAKSGTGERAAARNACEEMGSPIAPCALGTEASAPSATCAPLEAPREAGDGEASATAAGSHAPASHALHRSHSYHPLLSGPPADAVATEPFEESWPQVPLPSSRLPRSPSAPALGQRRWAPSDASAANAAATTNASERAATPAPRWDGSEQEEEAAAQHEALRKALLQPPTFEFTQYLRNLVQRWPTTPLARTRMAELGVSPSKLNARSYLHVAPPQPLQAPLAAAPFSGADMRAAVISAAAVAAASAATAASAAATVAAAAGLDSSAAHPQLVHAVPGPAIATWPPAYHHAHPPPSYSPAYFARPMPSPAHQWGYGSVAPHSWPRHWSMPSPYPPPPARPLATNAWPPPPWPSASLAAHHNAFSTATLPAARSYFRYVQ